MATIKMSDSQNTVLTKTEISEISTIYSWEDTLCNKQKKKKKITT